MTIIHNGLESSLGLISGSADRTPATQGNAAHQTPQVVTPAEQASEVDITPTAKAMAGLEHQLASVPDVDQSRIDSIRQALSNKTYKVNAGRIADGLLAAQTFDAQAGAGAAGPQSSPLKAYRN